ncbi:MAG: SH3 domain-containing protein [Rhodospirillales bacterium]
MVLLGSPAARAEDGGTGLPLPRFVSLRSEEANLRAGPGVQYPVDWIYHKRGLPLEVIAEFQTWRKVRDWQGDLGWLHQSMLSGERTIIVTEHFRSLRSRPEPHAQPVATLEPGVIGGLERCPDTGDWCEITVDGYDGWLRRGEFWGIYRDEVID